MEENKGFLAVVIRYLGIAFFSLLVTTYVASPAEVRWKVMIIAAIVGAAASGLSLLVHPPRLR